MGESQWFFTWDEFKECAPSLKYLTLPEELENRRIGTEFINKLGHALGINQLIISTAQVFFHRFYLRESFKQYPLNEMALTMVFLASKVEESPRKLRDVILKGLSIRFKSSEVFSESSPEYLKLYDRVLQLEKMALAVLCFDLTIDHPFRHIARLFNSHPSKFDSEFTKHIWTIVTESFYTPIPILFPPKLVAFSLLIHEMSLKSDKFPNVKQAENLAEFIGGEWKSNFGKVSKEEIDNVLIFLNQSEYYYKKL